MRRYIIQRTSLMPLVALAVMTAVFAMVRLLPGDVVSVLSAEAPQYGDASELRAELGLDQPVAQQYASFLGNVVTGDFGTSLFFQRPISEDLARAVPVTVEVTVLAVVLSVALAVPLGVITATQRNTPFDRVIRVVSMVFYAVPTFWLGSLAITFLALWFRWSPPIQYRPIWEDPVSNLAQFIVPATVLAIGSLGLKVRLVRSQMLEVLEQDYIRTARAKGLTGRLVVGRHALRNALVPVVAIIGNQMGGLIGGAVVVESIFGLPGLGRLLIDGVDHRDYPMVQAAVLITAFLLVAVNLLIDLIFAWLDPRIRYA